MSERSGYLRLRDVITARRTINFFEPDEVPDEWLEDALRAARWAPNHRLTEPWQFLLPGPKTVRRIVDLAVELARSKGDAAAAARLKRLEAIPHWLVVTSELDSNPLVSKENYAACCCVMQNLALLLWKRGVGLKWTTGAINRDPRFAEIMGIDPDAEEIVGVFWYGVPAKVPSSRRSPLIDALRRLP